MRADRRRGKVDDAQAAGRAAEHANGLMPREQHVTFARQAPSSDRILRYYCVLSFYLGTFYLRRFSKIPNEHNSLCSTKRRR